MFFTTFHLTTNSLQTTARVKIDTGAQTYTIPLICFKKMFPHKINSPQYCTEKAWVSHDRKPQKFVGQIILDVHYKTTGRSYPLRFDIFKDTTSTPILICYVASERLCILQFKLHNETTSAQIDPVTTQQEP